MMIESMNTSFHGSERSERPSRRGSRSEHQQNPTANKLIDKPPEGSFGSIKMQHHQPTAKSRPTILLQRTLAEEQQDRPKQRQTSTRQLVNVSEEHEELVSKVPMKTINQPPQPLPTKRGCFGRSQSLRMIVNSNDNAASSEDTDDSAKPHGPSRGSALRMGSSRSRGSDWSTMTTVQDDDTESSHGDQSRTSPEGSDNMTDRKPHPPSSSIEDKISAFRRTAVRRSHPSDVAGCVGYEAAPGSDDEPSGIKTTQACSFRNRSITSEKGLGNASPINKDEGEKPRGFRKALSRSMSCRMSFGDDTETIVPRSSRLIVVEQSAPTTTAARENALPSKPLVEEKPARGLRGALSRTPSCRLNFADEMEPTATARETALSQKPLVEEKLPQRGLRGAMGRTPSCRLNFAVDEAEPITTEAAVLPQKPVPEARPTRGLRSTLSRSRSCRLSFGGEDNDSTTVTATATTVTEPILLKQQRPMEEKQRGLRGALGRTPSCRWNFAVDEAEPIITEAAVLPQKPLPEARPTRGLRSTLSRSRSCRLNFGGEDNESITVTATATTFTEPILLKKQRPMEEKPGRYSRSALSSRSLSFGGGENEQDATMEKPATRGSLRPPLMSQSRNSSRTSFSEKVEGGPEATETTVETSEELKSAKVTVSATAVMAAAAASNGDEEKKKAVALCLLFVYTALRSMVTAVCLNPVVRAVAAGTFDLLLYVAGAVLTCVGWLLTVTATAIGDGSQWLINQPVVRDALIAAYCGNAGGGGGGGRPPNNNGKKQE